jgi:uncharacterized membrane protein SirB2
VGLPAARFQKRGGVMDYLDIRAVHVSCVFASISLFALRGGLQLAGVAWRRWRLLRVAPHLIDTVLLCSAIWLASVLHQYPFVNAWLTAKVLALCAYILIGREVFREGRPHFLRVWAYCAALLCVGYIVAVALTHSPSLG